MKPPATIVIGPHVYTVAVVDDLGDNLVGDTDCTQLVIRLKAGMADSATAETCLHECLHAAWDASPLRALPEDIEEGVVSMYAPAILDLLRRNPKLLALLVP